MNKPNNMKNRQRGRNNGGGGKPRPMGGGGPNRNPNFDGGNMRPRGNAQQLMEKFLAMARDASAMGDRVAAENYFQHADHYYRVLNARFEQQQQNGGFNNGQQRNQHGGQRGFDGEPNDQGGDHQQSGGQGDRQGYNQGGQNYGQDANRHEGNRQDFNRNNNNNTHNQGNYGGQNYDRQPHQETQPSAENYQTPSQSYQAPEPAPSSGQADQEIGLPPGILGISEPAPPQPPNAPAFEGGSDEQRAPRRRRGRGPGVPRPGTGSQD